MNVVWELLSDSKIIRYLQDVDKDMSPDAVRLLFLELLCRIKALEEDNLVCRLLLIENGLVDEGTFDQMRSSIREFLSRKDRQTAVESDFFASSGIPFHEWVNFKLKGSFGDDEFKVEET